MQKGRDERPLAATAGVRVERNDRHCVVYRGTRTALIAAGLARAAHFPEGERRFSWHFPRSGVNWGVRRKGGNVYCLTKLKDPQGVVEAELAAFYRSAGLEAQRDTRFQLFLQQIRGSADHAGARRDNKPAAARLARTPMPVAVERLAPRSKLRAAPLAASGLDTLALATLLVGLTVYLWTRQS